ncbi:hypothetical protein NIES37_14150 [Tolypothrix tenuis PCC 7101]|uniref:Uncharacterized protein n=1 Tax=Tolypothrix tenuis PCC 7101 TaxID=231146 RepID=A0A1Z4MVM1_9CYAN|nr:hypothetical protein NIES37_14150 [Tolypothrix tenuis PCC 7101]BAZ72018.1 hypothetical protein NIES50_05670 [Aulosira laxa NIES-50]
MVKPINYIMERDRTRYGASLQVVLSECNFWYKSIYAEINSIFDYHNLYIGAKFNNKNNLFPKYFSLEKNYKIYKINLVIVAIKEKKINTVSCKINDSSKSLVVIKEEHIKCQRNPPTNRQQQSRDPNLWLKLYRSFLSKYRYTSLELVVRSAAFLADAVAKFRTDNPVRVGSSENNKEHCHICSSVKL